MVAASIPGRPCIGVQTLHNALCHVVGAGGVQRRRNDPNGFDPATMVLTIRIKVSPMQLAEAAELLNKVTQGVAHG